MAIGADQTGGTEQGAAEVARDHRRDVDEIAHGEHGQHRSARSAGWFAVVVRALEATALTDSIRCAVVVRVPVLLPSAFDDCFSFVFSPSARQGADEA